MTTLYTPVIKEAIEAYCHRNACSRLEVKAALIDMDGVLYDSMPNHARAWSRLCEEKGIKASYNEFFIYEGMTGAAIIRLLYKRQFGQEVSDEEARDTYAIKARYFSELDAGKPMPGADKVLDILAQHDVMRVLVTGSGQKSLLWKLNADYPGAFQENLQITAHDVKRGKPDPEPYLMGQKKARAIPQQCIVIENAPLGVRAGHESGAFTIAVATGPIPVDDLRNAGADLVLSSMNELAEILPELLRIASESEFTGNQQIVFTNEVDSALSYLLRGVVYNRIFLITDSKIEAEVLPAFGTNPSVLTDAQRIVIPSGEKYKTIETVMNVWQQLQQNGATRKSIIINIGGGVVTDLGGFAASTFKRGLRFINIPTTLLSAVDAAVGGKTGVNFNGLKNEIGVFNEACGVIISTRFLNTLSKEEIKSGYAEMIKHALLLSAEELNRLLNFDISCADYGDLLPMLAKSVKVKRDIVEKDPQEQGLRRALNLGHTVGHAFESMALMRGKPIPHGYAVAWGVVVELVLSHMIEKFDSALLNRVAEYICKMYGAFYITCDDYPQLNALMQHDKKSEHGELNFTLLKAPGDILTGCVVRKQDVEAALDIYRDLMHI